MNGVYYAHPTHEMCQVLSYLVEFKASGSFEIHWVRQSLVNIILFGIKYM